MKTLHLKKKYRQKYHIYIPSTRIIYRDNNKVATNNSFRKPEGSFRIRSGDINKVSDVYPNLANKYFSKYEARENI